MPDTIEDALRSFAAGQIIVVADDDDREGEGDLIVAASRCSTEQMAFIIRSTSGIVCAPMTAENARRLRLDPMVAHNDSNHTTAFTISVDYRPRVTTGISAEERVVCCRALANSKADATDFIRPGHVFPLVAREGGVLFRSGHTEAAVDLCKLTGLPPVGILSELMNENGTVMKGPQVAEFAKLHSLKYITIADIISYRQAREKLVERISTLTVETPFGPLQGYAYRSPFDEIFHAAFVYNDIGDGENVLTRFHLFNIFKDVCFSSQRVIAALEQFRENGSGVLIFLRDGAAGVPVTQLDNRQSREEDRNRQWREVGLGAQILRDLGIRSIRHLTSSTHDYKGLSGFGIEITGSEPFREPVWKI